MNKAVKFLLISVAVIVIIAAVVVCLQLTGVLASKPVKTNLEPITSAADLETLVGKIYEGLEVEMPMLMTQTIDTTDNDAVKYATGLENADNLEYVVESAPMMMAQPYSLILAKAKDGVNVEEIAKEMNEKIDNRKWICVTAEKVYTTNSGNVICLVMSNEDTAKAVYEKFKTLAGGYGKEFERSQEEIVLPDDMLPAYDGETVYAE